MWKKIGLGIGAVIILILGYAAMQPKEMYVVRELVIKASPEVLFPYINSTKKADEWMPWGEEDPTVKTTYSGPEQGLGAMSSWESTGKMGTGKAEIVESIPNQSVKTQLTYTKPFEMSQLAEITLTPSAEGTTVKWSVKGNSTFLCRVMGVFMNMDKMVGGQFEKGLNKLKTLAEPKS